MLRGAATAVPENTPAKLITFSRLVRLRTSTCTVRDSPCRDEHVIYEIRPDGANWKIDADKLVAGKRVPMGPLQCQWREPTLSCAIPRGEWLFTVSGDVITGTLTVEKKIFRNVIVRRRS